MQSSLSRLRRANRKARIDLGQRRAVNHTVDYAAIVALGIKKVVVLHPTKGYRVRNADNPTGNYTRGPLTGAELFQATFTPKPKAVILAPNVDKHHGKAGQLVEGKKVDRLGNIIPVHRGHSLGVLKHQMNTMKHEIKRERREPAFA